MSFETDLLIDRRRLKRRLFLWRAVAVCAAAAALILAFAPRGFGPGHGAHVARLRVNGLITEDRRLLEAVEKVADDPNVPALIVSIDSPGGSVAGGESLHDAIARVAARKPVVAVMHGLAASAGYMVALPAQRIFAQSATLTGSIGVLMETAQVGPLLDKIGVGTETIVSGPLKDQPGLFHPTSPAGQEVLKGLVMDLYGQFVGMVAEGRHMDPARVRQLADGRAYTGQQALKLGLIDEIGQERDARAWLARTKDVAARLPVQDIAPDRGWRQRLFGAVFHGVLKSIFGQGLTVQGLLDRPLALWQPAAGENLEQ